MKLEHSIQTAQKLQISQNRIQSLEILAMDGMQLRDFMQNEYLENPLIEYTGNQDAVHGPDDISSRYEYNITYGKNYEDVVEEDDQRSKDLPSVDPDFLKKAILYQLPQKVFTEEESLLFNYMVDCLDETGFFTISLEEVAANTHTSLSAVEHALHILQQVEPHGIFARDLRECLLIQLDYSKMRGSDTWRIVDKHLEDVAKGRISTISRSLSLTTAQIRKCIGQIVQLNPRPMNALGNNKSHYIVPDILLHKEYGHWEIELNDHWIEDYRINEYYLRLMNESRDPELNAYFQSKLERIRFIQNCILQRRQTILRIMKALVTCQEPFFDGESALVPMTMAAFADELQLHPSTVSRAIKGKYLQCPKGTLALRELFSATVSYDKNASPKSANAIKEQICLLIQDEDKKKPLSDQKILNLLKKDGISISRRAIALYREELGIKSSYERKSEQAFSSTK